MLMLPKNQINVLRDMFHSLVPFLGYILIPAMTDGVVTTEMREMGFLAFN